MLNKSYFSSYCSSRFHIHPNYLSAAKYMKQQGNMKKATKWGLKSGQDELCIICGFSWPGVSKPHGKVGLANSAIVDLKSHAKHCTSKYQVTLMKHECLHKLKLGTALHFHHCISFSFASAAKKNCQRPQRYEGADQKQQKSETASDCKHIKGLLDHSYISILLNPAGEAGHEQE